jgi:oxygen-dependent protoporphyrinogen oxidase
MKVGIAGAGFSGMTLAYFLVKRGASVDIFERQPNVGGLIGTKSIEFGLAETAANGLWNTPLLEQLFLDLEIEFAPRKAERKNRFIFRGRPKKWPLTVLETVELVCRFTYHWIARSHRPRPSDSISDWATRVGGSSFAKYMLAPVLQGIYAGDATKMSASLILGRFFNGVKAPKPLQRGTVAPLNGMGELITKLESWLKKNGVQFIHEPMPNHFKGPRVFATSVWDATESLRSQFPALAFQLSQAEILPLISATLFFEHAPDRYRGFGCLFPKEEKFHSLGVLFNSDIYENRSAKRSETWIMGGALNRPIIKLGDADLIEKILADRKRVFGSDEKPLGFAIQRWPRALPHYTNEWKLNLERLNVRPPLYLTGNYLGQIGLSKILEYNRTLSERILNEN